jgi:hypothetical protein
MPITQCYKLKKWLFIMDVNLSNLNKIYFYFMNFYFNLKNFYSCY